ncbi:Hypothetical protein D9617_29g006690 [Elsinoe fawcettii]|nr:Hypothetical protein D9617_29g006690 [Elsinoe fawcettii]
MVLEFPEISTVKSGPDSSSSRRSHHQTLRDVMNSLKRYGRDCKTREAFDKGADRIPHARMRVLSRSHIWKADRLQHDIEGGSAELKVGKGISNYAMMQNRLALELNNGTGVSTLPPWRRRPPPDTATWQHIREQRQVGLATSQPGSDGKARNNDQPRTNRIQKSWQQ